MMNKILLLTLTILLFSTTNSFACSGRYGYCLSTETRVNHKTGKIYDVTKKHEYRFFETLECAEKFAEENGLEDNILKDQDFGYYVFLKKPKRYFTCSKFSY